VDIDAQAACDSGGVPQYRHLVNGRAAARSCEWAQHFSNASSHVRGLLGGFFWNRRYDEPNSYDDGN